jgi:type VI secretion system protein VasJ
MGTGSLAGWKNHWDLLPFALEKIWTQMEYLSSKRYIDFRQLEEDMRIIKPPEPLWRDYIEERRKRYDSTANPDGAVPWDVLELRRQVSALTRRPEVIAPIKVDASSDPITPVGLWHTLLKDSVKALPNAVFIGGVGGRTNLAAFMRALSPNDFVRIWSTESNASDGKETG